MKGILTLILFTMLLFSKEYSVDLYDYDGKGHWQMVGVGSFQNDDEVSNVRIIDGSFTVSTSEDSGIPKPDFFTGVDRDTITKLLILDTGTISEVTLSIDGDNNLTYYDEREGISKIFINVGGDDAQIEMHFLNSYLGKEFQLDVTSQDGSSSKYRAEFQSSTAMSPISAQHIDESEAVPTTVDLTSEKSVSDVVTMSDGSSFTGDHELRVYGYEPDNGWIYWNNRNTDEQNLNFGDFQSGRGYWVKFTEGGSSDAHKVAKFNLDNNSYQLTEKNLDSFASHYGATISDGWNLLSFPDSNLRNVVTGAIINFDISGTADLNISLKYDQYRADINSSHSKLTSASTIAEEINKQIFTKFPGAKIRAISMVTDGTDGNITIISDKSFDVNESWGDDLFQETKDLLGKPKPSNLDSTPQTFEVNGTYAIFLEPSQIKKKSGAGVLVNVNNHDINLSKCGGSLVATDIETTAKVLECNLTDLSGLNGFRLNLNFGNDANETVLVTSLDKIEVSDKTNLRKYKMNLESVIDEWNSGSTRDFSFTFIKGDTTVPFTISKPTPVDTATVAKLIEAEVDGNITNIEDSKKEAYLALIDNSANTLRVYDNVENRVPLIVTPSYTSISTLKNIYRVSDIFNSEIESDGKLAISPAKTPTRVGLSTDTKTAINTLSVLDRAGYRVGRVLFGENELLNSNEDKISWRLFDTNVKEEDIFNSIDKLDLFSIEKEKGYWFYLQSKTGDEGEIVLEDLSFQKNFEHYYDINQSTTISMLMNSPLSISIDPEAIPQATLEELFGYIKINGVTIPLDKSGNSFSVNIHGYDIGRFDEANISIYISNGKGMIEEFTSSILELNLTKPSKPIMNLSSTGSGIDNNFVLFTRTDDSTDYFEIYKDPIGNTDSTQAFNSSEYAQITFDVNNTATVSLTSIMGEFQESLTLQDGVKNLLGVSKSAKLNRNSVLSDIAVHKFVSLYCGSNELKVDIGTESRFPIEYDSQCNGAISSDNRGVTLKSFDTSASIFYSKIDDENLNTTELPNFMLIGFDGVDASLQVSFTNEYKGRPLYILHDGSLYKGEFKSGYDTNVNPYKLDRDAEKIY